MNVVRGVRRTAIIAIVLSLVVAAVLGIVALLSGDFGELQAKVLLSTLTVAAFGTTALCHLAVVARAVRLVGFAGIAASVVAAVSAFVLIWGNWGDSVSWEWQEAWLKALYIAGILALSLAQANLLLLLAGRPQRLVRVALGLTLAAIAIVALMILLPVLSDGAIPGENDEWYWRTFGVVSILDALGTIALPILALVLRRSEAAAADEGAQEAAAHAPTARLDLALRLTPGLADRLDAHARATGTTPEQAALAILDTHLEAQRD